MGSSETQFYFPIKSLSLKGKTLILPIVSAGNVAQLAADLLIFTLELRHVGTFDPSDLIPAVGSRDDGPGVATPLELYGKEGSNVVVVQQRTPVLKARKESFATSILNFVKESEFSSILLLTGADVTNRSDAQMLSPSYVLVPPNAPTLEGSPIQLASKLPAYQYQPSVGHLEGAEALMPRPAIPIIPSGGLTRRLLWALSSQLEKPIPTAAVLQFVVEGDNRSDAEFFARTVSQIIGIQINSFKQPPSWRNGSFGTPHDQSLYG